MKTLNFENFNSIDFKNYFEHNNPLETSRALTSLKSIYTFFNNRYELSGYLSIFLPNIDKSVLNHQCFSTIENYIYSNIRKFLKEKNNDLLINIFHAIQFWGGGQSRYIYCKDGGFQNNFKIDEYKRLISILEKNGNKNEVIQFLKNNSFNQLGTAFLTKHLQFWSEVILGEEKAYPIFDSIMSKNLFNKITNVNKYEEYLNTLDELALKNKCSRLHISKVLFDYFDRNKL